ncbi:MAG: hypothetical protein WA005_15990 [Candidatus Binataceae bacterium]
MESRRDGNRAVIRWLLILAVALALAEDLVRIVPDAIAGLSPIYRDTLLADSHRIAGLLTAAVAARVDILGSVSIILFCVAGILRLMTQLRLRLRPAQRQHPGLEDRLDVLTRLMTNQVGERPTMRVRIAWNANVKAFIELREGLRTAWTQALPVFAELAVVLNRTEAILDRLSRNELKVDLGQAAELRDHGNRRIAELRAALNCILDILGRDQPTFGAPLPAVNEMRRRVAL